MPNYLRTKLDLDLEAKQKELAEQVANKGAEFSSEVKKFNEMLSSGIERVTEVREELEEQKSKTGEWSVETSKQAAMYMYMYDVL